MEEWVDLHEEAGKENKQTFANLSLAEEATSKGEIEICFCSFAFLFGHIINILLTELGQSVWENLNLRFRFSHTDLLLG